MKKLDYSIIAFFLGIIILFSCSSSKKTENFSQKLVKEIQQSSRLDWIKSTGDFEQKELTANQIDNQIAQLIRQAVANNQRTVDIEIPINTKKLTYLGKINPFTLDDLKNAEGNRSSLPHYDKTLHIYKYGDIYLSTQEDTQTDQLNIYYSIRAIEILKTRYPEAFKKLFIDSKQFLADEPKYGQWLNRNKAFWIAFNTNPEGISSNNHFFITENKTPKNNSTSVNIAAMNFHESKILGKDRNAGSRPVYNQATDEENYRLHMREGVIVSIVHEMLHNYIQYAAGVSDQFQKISSLRGKQDAILAEEAVVVNTTYQYFRNKGGLMPEQEAFYYPRIFEGNLLTLKNKNLLTNYATYFSDLVPNDTNWREVFIINGIFS